jgi:hypothetical protein
MPGDQTFEQQLQPHVGGLVRVCYGAWAAPRGLNGKIGLLMGVATSGRALGAQIELLIDGRVRILLVYPHELELLPADDA